MTRENKKKEHLSGISIYLLKKYDKITDILRKDDSNRNKGSIIHEENNFHIIGHSPNFRSPDWINFIEKSSNIETEKLKNYKIQSSYGLIIITTNVLDKGGNTLSKSFAIPLGHGIHLLNLNYIEHSFGLKSVVNAVAYDDLRELDLTVPEQNSQKKKFQSSTNVNTTAFDINKQKDLLKGITGTMPELLSNLEQLNLTDYDKEKLKTYDVFNIEDGSESYPVGKSLSGKDFVKVSARIDTIQEIEKLCQRLFKYSNLEIYKDKFAWIDNFRSISSHEDVYNKLNNKLALAISKKESSNMTITNPIFVDEMADYDGYTFLGNRFNNNDSNMFPTIDDFFNYYGDDKLKKFAQKDGISLKGVDLLKKSCKLRMVNKDEAAKHIDWPLYKCISWETTLNEDGEEKRFILSDGLWYEIDDKFKERTEQIFKDHLEDEPSEIMLPAKKDHNLEGYTGNNRKYEAGYNQYIGKSFPDRTVIFDKGVFPSKGIGSDGSEFCDIFDLTEKQMIHVKVGKSSADLSHLFRQGSFSAEMLKKETAEFRKDVIKKSGSDEFNNLFNYDFNSSEWAVRFAVIIKKNQLKNIPFFSKVSFNHAINEINRDGYKKTKLWFIWRDQD